MSLTSDEKAELTAFANGAGNPRSANERIPAVLAALARGDIAFPEGRIKADLSQDDICTIQLVAEGRSNPRIAERLLISVDTVKSRLAKVMRPSGINSRTQLASIALRDGLVVAHGYDASIPRFDAGQLNPADRRKLQVALGELASDGWTPRISTEGLSDATPDEVLDARHYLVELLGTNNRYMQVLRAIDRGLVQRPPVRPAARLSPAEQTVVGILATSERPSETLDKLRIGQAVASSLLMSAGAKLQTASDSVVTVVQAVHTQSISLEAPGPDVRRVRASISAVR